MPENGRHYFGINLERPGPVLERIADDPGSLERAAAAGREWAIANYAPAAMARRFLAEAGVSVPSGRN